jgi:hypothetical protein
MRSTMPLVRGERRRSRGPQGQRGGRPRPAYRPASAEVAPAVDAGRTSAAPMPLYDEPPLPTCDAP